MSDIKACPFCGGTPRLAGKTYVRVECKRCLARSVDVIWFHRDDEGDQNEDTPRSFDEAEDRAVAFWNQRVP